MNRPDFTLPFTQYDIPSLSVASQLAKKLHELDDYTKSLETKIESHEKLCEDFVKGLELRSHACTSEWIEGLQERARTLIKGEIQNEPNKI